MGKIQFEVIVTMTLRLNDQLIDEWLPDAVQENLEEGEEILSYTDALVTHNVGQQCPSCDSHEIASIDQVSTDNGTAWHEVECNSCDATWQDVYTLTGYDNLKEY